MQTDKNPLSPPCTTKIVFCSRSRNYHLFTRVRHTRLFTSGTACDWWSKVPPSKRGLLLVVSRGLGKEPFNREGALQWLSTTAKVFACLSSWFFRKTRVFLRSFAWVIEKKWRPTVKQMNRPVRPKRRKPSPLKWPLITSINPRLRGCPLCWRGRPCFFHGPPYCPGLGVLPPLGMLFQGMYVFLHVFTSFICI